MCAYDPETSLFWQISIQNNFIGCFLSRNRVEIWQFCQPATPQYFPTARTGFGAASSLEEATELGAKKKQKSKLSEANSKRCRALESFMAIFLVRGQKAAE